MFQYLYFCVKIVAQLPRAARGCSKKGIQECCLCNKSFTSLIRHNCKGLAMDGGIKARRILKFCPLCPDFTALVEDLPKHIRKVIFAGLKCSLVVLP